MSSLLEKLDDAVAKLAAAKDNDKYSFQAQVLEISGSVLTEPKGIAGIYERIDALVNAGVFMGTDWKNPQHLVPQLVPTTLASGAKETVVLDCISQLRMLSLVEHNRENSELSAEQAQAFLSTVLSLNLNYVLGNVDETARVRLGDLAPAVAELYQYLLSHLGYEAILSELVNEVWRILAQRPIQVNSIKTMITQISIVVSKEDVSLGEAKLGVDRLVSALYSPTQGCANDPGVAAYAAVIETMDAQAIAQEASGFARAMHDVGLVSDYHAVFLRWLLHSSHSDILPQALGLSSTGLDSLLTYRQLVHTLIDEAIFPATAQAIYGLTMVLEQGILFVSPVAPSLWRQINVSLHPQVETRLQTAFGHELPARVRLLAGVIAVLGQPLGIAQGNNPTCQSARALSMWAYNDPDYLLNAIVQVACHDNLRMHFEGQPIDSNTLLQGLSNSLPIDTDPVSVILVPHLDKLYIAMGRLCADRGEDPHKWINPEFHGWYVGREFMIAVDIYTGKLKDYDAFLQRFYHSYHPLYNGNVPVIHPQPVGIAVTDSQANFVGWHAVTLVRVALDQEHVMRVYFYNPNNDSGQNWGNGIEVSTQGKGEYFGEASLPFAEFLSRLYLYHDDTINVGLQSELPTQEIKIIKAMATNSWAQV